MRTFSFFLSFQCISEGRGIVEARIKQFRCLQERAQAVSSQAVRRWIQKLPGGGRGEGGGAGGRKETAGAMRLSLLASAEEERERWRWRKEGRKERSRPSHMGSRNCSAMSMSCSVLSMSMHCLSHSHSFFLISTLTEPPNRQTVGNSLWRFGFRLVPSRCRFLTNTER